MKIFSTTNKKGFTLIELLVVISIIGILAVGAVSVFSGGKEKAQVTVAKDSVTQLMSGLQNYKAINGVYPRPSNDSGAVQSHGLVGKLGDGQGIGTYLTNFTTSNNVYQVNESDVYYATSADGNYYALGITYDDPNTGVTQNYIRSTFPGDVKTWTMFKDAGTTIMVDEGTGTGNLLSDMTTDGTEAVAQGFTLLKRDSDTIRIVLTSGLTTDFANGDAAEAMFTATGMTFGDNSGSDPAAGATFLDLDVSDAIDLGVDSLALAAAANDAAGDELDNANGDAVDATFPAQTVLGSDLAV